MATITKDVSSDREVSTAYEASYRRGVHQALALAGDLAERAGTVDELRYLLNRAEDIARDLRRQRSIYRGDGLLDEIMSQLN